MTGSDFDLDVYRASLVEKHRVEDNAMTAWTSARVAVAKAEEKAAELRHKASELVAAAHLADAQALTHLVDLVGGIPQLAERPSMPVTVLRTAVRDAWAITNPAGRRGARRDAGAEGVGPGHDTSA